MAQLFVGQLPFNKFYPDDLIHLFRPFGVVVAHELYIRTGSGFVTFATTDEADAAISALHGKKVVEGRVQPLQVMYSKGSKLISSFGRQHRAMCGSRDMGAGKKSPVMSVTASESAKSFPAAFSGDAASSAAFPTALAPPLMPLCYPAGAGTPALGAPPFYSVVYVMAPTPAPVPLPTDAAYTFAPQPFFPGGANSFPVMV